MRIDPSLHGPRTPTAAGTGAPEAAGGRAQPQRRQAPEDEAGGKALPPEEAARGEDGPREALRRIEAYVQGVRRELRFSVDETTGRTVIRVLDAETEEVIRQIPPEELMAVARSLAEGREAGIEGLLFRARA